MNVITLLLANIAKETKVCRGQLEVEESGRKVATLQGKITGYKSMVSHICAEYLITQDQIESIGDEPPIVPELKDEDINLLNAQRIVLEGADENWTKVQARVKKDFDRLKDDLFYSAQSTRDLDLVHGQRDAETYWQEFFRLIKDIAEDREKKLMERLKNPELFDGQE